MKSAKLVRLEAAVIRAATCLWKRNNPWAMSFAEFVACPTVNTCNGYERDLARACAALVIARREERKRRKR